MSLSLFATTNQGQLGYGSFSRNLALALNRRVPITLFPKDGAPQSPAFSVMSKRHLLSFQPDVSLSIGGPWDSLLFHGKKRAFVTMWEGSSIPKPIVQQLNGLDILLATSEWMKKMYVSSGVNEQIVHVVKGGVDTLSFAPPGALPEPKKTPPFTFLAVGKFEERKASPEILKAFLDTFWPTDDVQLICKFTSPTTLPLRQIKEVLQPMFTSADPAVVAKVKFVDSDRQSLVELYQQADCLVMPSRAEGIGLPLLEAMACGVPAITTPYTSHVEYTDSSCCVVLPDRGQIPAQDPRYGISPQTHGTWGAVHPADIGQAMRQFVDLSKDKRKEMGKAARRHVLQYDWNEMAGSLLNVLGV